MQGMFYSYESAVSMIKTQALCITLDRCPPTGQCRVV